MADQPLEYQETAFFEAFDEWQRAALIEQVSRFREHVDLVITMKNDALKERAAELKREQAAAKAAMKALGVKRKYKTRKDKGTKRPKPSADQVTE